VLGATLALTASVMWGCADFLGGLTSRKVVALVVVFLSQAAALSVFAIVMAVHGEGPPRTDFWLVAAVSGLCEAVALAAFYRGLSLGAMGVVAPIAASAAIVPVLWGLATGEDPSALQSIGIVTALIGVFLVCRESTPESGVKLAAGAGLAAVAALGFGFFYVAIGEATARANPGWAVFFNRTVLVTLLAVAVIATRPSFPSFSPKLWVIALVGFLDVGASTIYATASTHSLLSVVGLLGSLYPVITVMLAGVFLKERLGPVRATGAVVVLVSVLLVGGG
jgi:drug/metabolite transporter (DMT)-like permease